MRLRLLALAAALAALAALASGCPHAPDPGSDAGPLPADYDRFISAYCAYGERCAPSFGRAWADAAACEAWARSTFGCIAGTYAYGFELTVDAAAVDACVAALAAAPCDDAVSIDPACADFLALEPQGSAAEGEACDENFACAPALYCRIQYGICSICVRPAELGEPCNAVRCAAGLHCDGATVSCAAPSPPGAPCVEAADCDSGACAGSICAAAVPRGDPCAPGDACAGLLACIAGTCADRLPGGAACAADDDCFVDHWCTGGTCTPIAACAAQPLGQRCDPDALIGCAAGAFCDLMNVAGPVCQVATAPGALCSASDECGAGARCEMAAGGFVCAAYAREDEPCQSDFDCAGDLFCTAADLCALPGAAGAACTADQDCASGYCDVTGSAACAPYPVCP